MSYTYGRSKVMIEQHRQKYQRELKKIENEINKHMKQIPLAILDVHKIIEMITNFINQDQYQLRIEFERRRNILKFDAQDYQLAQNFLKLTPRQTEIHSAKIIWKAIRDEQILRCELVIFKKWLLHKSSTLMTYSFQDLPLIQMNAIFTQLIFDRQSSLSGITEDTSSSISINHSIDEFADALITQTLFIADQLAHIATDEKNKLLLTRDTSKNLPLLDKIISIIEHGQMNMVERIQYNTQQKLKILLNDTNSENNLDQ